MNVIRLSLSPSLSDLLVRKDITQFSEMFGVTSDEAKNLNTMFSQIAESGGGFGVYDWSNLANPGMLPKISYIYKLSLQGRTYYGGVEFDHVRAPVQLMLDTGRKSKGDPIICSSQYGSKCSERNAQAILGQALGDLIVASSETKIRISRFYPVNITIQDVFKNITAGNELYKINDFHVAVFSLDETLCDDPEQELSFSDDSGCCVAHGGDPSLVGLTWQQILDAQQVTSIRGRDLHDRLIGTADSGGQWIQYSFSQASGGSKQKVAFSSRFRDNGNDYYVFVEYVGEEPPPTCDACPTGMECTADGQDFCTPTEEDVPFVKTIGFIAIMVVAVGFPILAIVFCWVGKKRQDYLTKAQLEEMNQQVDTITKHLESEKQSASRAKKLMSSLFPTNVQDRILEQLEEDNDSEVGGSRHGGRADTTETSWTSEENKQNVKFVDIDDHDVTAVNINKTRPIADLFPETTIIFADIVGFTAWSSTRDASQVFQLLETIYCSFDKYVLLFPFLVFVRLVGCMLINCNLFRLILSFSLSLSLPLSSLERLNEWASSKLR
jgi:hypothetical protein